MDLGATKINAVLVEDGKILASHKVETGRGLSVGVHHLIDVFNAVSELIPKKEIKGIGVGAAGPMNYKKNILLRSPNLHWHKVDLVKLIRKRAGIAHVVVRNDAQCAAIAEKIYGKGQRHKNFVVVTLGTGIGAGVFVNNRLLQGKIYNGTELGHTTIKVDGLKCSCGRNGCWERYASGKAICERAQKALGKPLKAVELVKLAKKGNKKAKLVLDESADYIATGLGNVVNIFNPELIILSGGVVEAGDYFFKMVKKKFEKDKKFFGCKLELSDLNEKIALGASCLI